MTTKDYLIIALAVAVIVLLFVVIGLAKANTRLKFGGIKVKKGRRYTTDELPEMNGEANITYNQKDIILEVNKEYIVGKSKKMLPGTYVVLASNETYTKFNLRIGGVVREYEHGQKIVLNEGDSITAVSHVVILR